MKRLLLLLTLFMAIALAGCRAPAPAAENDAPAGEATGDMLPDETLAELVRLTLERALVAQEIPDYALLTAETEAIILSTEHIGPALVPELNGVELLALTPEEIQARANEVGDFLYLRFDEITAVSENVVQVALFNTWIRAEGSEMLYLSGGGFVVEYTETAAGWQGEVISSWISRTANSDGNG